MKLPDTIRRFFITTAIQLLVILAVMGILMFLAFKGSDFVRYFFAAAFIGGAAMLGFYVTRAVVRGELPGRFGTVTYRHSSPIGFWFQVGVCVLFAGFIFFSGVALLGLAPHWFLALLRSMHSHP